MLDSRKNFNAAAARRTPGREEAESERGLEDAVTRLQKAALRYVFGAYGRTPELDQHLNALKARLRTQRRAADINAAIEEALTTIARVEAEQRAAAERSVPRFTLSLVDRVPWPETSRAALHKVKLTATEAIEQGPLQVSPASLAEAFANLLESLAGASPRASATAPPDERAVTVRSLSRMLERMDTRPELGNAVAQMRTRLDAINEQTDVLTVLDEIASMLARVLEESQQKTNAAANPTETWQAPLLHLLNRLSLPADLGKDLAAIKRRLTNRRGTETETVVVTQIANLVDKLRKNLQHEIDEIGAFLKQVLLRLQDLHLHVMQSQSVRTEALKDSGRLNEMVAQHVKGIRMSIDSAVSLDEIKASVGEQLNGISADMSAFVEAERQRNEEAQAAVSQLSTQLKDLTSETMHLRESLKEHQEKAVRDALTGVPNRMGYEERLAEEYSRWQRHQRPLSTVVFDVDFFKSINDQYGHQAGDKVLMTVAEQLSSQIRESDFFARYGGEEFVLLLPETEIAEARQLADKLRVNIERCKFRYGENPVPVTVSCGVSEFRGEDLPHEPFERADQALYQAKRTGRNRVCTDLEIVCETAPAQDAAGA